MNEDHYLTGRVIDGKIYVDNADLWPFLKRKNAEIERLREALRDCHHVLHKLMAIVPGNDAAVDEMAKVMKKARATLGEGKE